MIIKTLRTKTLTVVLSFNLVLPAIAGEAQSEASLPTPALSSASAVAQPPQVSEPLPLPEPSSAPTVRTSPPAEPLTQQEELALAARNENPGPEVAGGAWSNQTLTYVVIALAAAVAVLVLK